jgi:hypothetical protein
MLKNSRRKRIFFGRLLDPQRESVLEPEGDSRKN